MRCGIEDRVKASRVYPCLCVPEPGRSICISTRFEFVLILFVYRLPNRVKDK